MRGQGWYALELSLDEMRALLSLFEDAQWECLYTMNPDEDPDVRPAVDPHLRRIRARLVRELHRVESSLGQRRGKA